MNGKKDKILFIAELSANHLGSKDRARELVLAAAASGANAIKFQTYTADTMTIDSDLPDESRAIPCGPFNVADVAWFPSPL